MSCYRFDVLCGMYCKVSASPLRGVHKQKQRKTMLSNTSAQFKVLWWRVRVCCPDLLPATKQHICLVLVHAASVSILRSLIRRPRRPFCLMMTRTTVITTILSDHREAGMTACGPWHGSVRHKCGIYGFLKNMSLERPPVSSYEPCCVTANMRRSSYS